MTLGVLLMTFGSPATLADLPAYLASVRGGRPAPEAVVQEFRRRYAVVGGSPLLAITRAQAAAVEARLNEPGDHEAAGDSGVAAGRYRVAVGMRHAPPLIGDALAELAAAGAQRIAAIILSPQYSPFIMGGYHRAVDAARDRLAGQGKGVEVAVAGAWHTDPGFVGALAQRVREALARLPVEVRDTAPIIFTAHSLPRPVVEREPGYLEQLQETVRALVERLGLAGDTGTPGGDNGPPPGHVPQPTADRQAAAAAAPPRSSVVPGGVAGAVVGRRSSVVRRWQFAYQSAGHTPEEWLKPDLKDLLPGLREAGHRHVLVVPIQFLADHLEILYDIDIAAREEAQACGVALHRIESLNCAPAFVDALAGIARRELTDGAAGAGHTTGAQAAPPGGREW